MREEGFSESEANQKWVEDLANPQVRREKKNGVLKLAVSGHEALVSEQGTSKEQRLSKKTVAETADERRAVSKRARRTHDMSDAHFADFGGDHFRDGAAAVAGPDRDGDCLLDDFDDDDDIFPSDSISSVAVQSRRGPCASASHSVAPSSGGSVVTQEPAHRHQPTQAASNGGYFLGSSWVTLVC